VRGAAGGVAGAAAAGSGSCDGSGAWLAHVEAVAPVADWLPERPVDQTQEHGGGQQQHRSPSGAGSPGCVSGRHDGRGYGRHDGGGYAGGRGEVRLEGRRPLEDVARVEGKDLRRPSGGAALDGPGPTLAGSAVAAMNLVQPLVVPASGSAQPAVQAVRAGPKQPAARAVSRASPHPRPARPRGARRALPRSDAPSGPGSGRSRWRTRGRRDTPARTRGGTPARPGPWSSASSR
jgi:hypothetical protein